LVDFNYTWSHTIDNQSEPLAGFAANLAEVNLTARAITLRPSGSRESLIAELIAAILILISGTSLPLTSRGLFLRLQTKGK
jgi:hypothetical protein